VNYVQHHPLPLAQALIFDLILRPKSADRTGVRKSVELMPDESQVLAAFGVVVRRGDWACHVRLHRYGPHGDLPIYGG
jgi:hypothetical protein